jgi:hypothetical protein
MSEGKGSIAKSPLPPAFGLAKFSSHRRNNAIYLEFKSLRYLEFKNCASKHIESNSKYTWTWAGGELDYILPTKASQFIPGWF